MHISDLTAELTEILVSGDGLVTEYLDDETDRWDRAKSRRDWTNSLRSLVIVN